MKGSLYQEVPQEEGGQTKKSCSQRWFGPMQAGGFRGSLLTLCSSMIGVGFLTLPEIGKKSGLFPMVGFILISAFISVFANWQIGRGFRHTQGKTYSKIVARVDSRTSSLINMVFLFLYVYVSAGAFYIFGSLSLCRCQVRHECRRQLRRPSELGGERQRLLGLLHLDLLRHLLPRITAEQDRGTEILHIHHCDHQPASRRCSLLLRKLLIYQIPTLRSFYENSSPPAKFETAKFDLNLFSSYCLSLFSSVNQFSVVNVLSEFQKPTERRVNKVASADRSLCSTVRSSRSSCTCPWL